MINYKLTFIKTGKCGGSTIKQTLEDHDINFDFFHIRVPKYNPVEKYLISLRNPVERFISAFYWRKHLVLDGDQKDRFAGEYDFFQKYATIEDLTRDDITVLKRQYVHHIEEDIHFYLGDLVNQLTPENVMGVVCAESLNKDMKRIFNIKVQTHLKNNSERKIPIKEEGRKILKEYLYKDYLVIEKLNNSQLLSKVQYKTLSK